MSQDTQLSALAIEILNNHKGNPNHLFYADMTTTSQLANRHGLNAIDAAYTELLNRGLVKKMGQIVSPLGQPRNCYQITPRGSEAMPIQQ
jgi:hypothetical protein